MTADSRDNFDYIPAQELESEAARKHYWAVAIGLQAVDGLEVSPYLRALSQQHIEGSTELKEAGSLLRNHHSENDLTHHREADFVSYRIAELLSSGAFALSPEFFSHVHQHLFQDLDEAVYHPGQFKPERMVKQEEILNGDSVLYADPMTYEMSLKGAFSAEQGKLYTAFDAEELYDFCHALAFLWQVHPFYEGNTRAVAVFSELYLNHLGFSVSNEPFEDHACYFRDALVRAIYRNAAAQIFPTNEYLIRFYENLLGQANNVLDREELICSALFEDPSLLRNVSPSSALVAK